MKRSSIFLSISLLSLSSQLWASDLSKANQTQLKTNQLSVVSQQKIDQDALHVADVKQQISQLKIDIENLEVYRAHLENLIADQNNEQESIKQQIKQIKQTRQGVVPLMYQMITSLEVIIKSDKPIKLEQRLTRLDEIKRMMSRADVSDAEKYRRILEAFQIELDYGNKISLYRDSIMLKDTSEREAELVAVGRLALVARSFDHSHYWYWNSQLTEWIEGNQAELAEIDSVFELATNQMAPTLISVPISVTVVEEQ